MPDMELYDAKGRLILRVEQEDESKLVHTPKQATAEDLRHLPCGSDYVAPTYRPIKVDDQGRIYVVTDTNADIETDATPTLGGDLDANAKKISALLSLDFSDFAEVTLDTDGEITVTQSCHTVDTFEDAASDGLVTINGGTNGMVIFLRPVDDARTVIVKHNTGNIWLKGKADLSLDDVRDCLCLVFDGTKWMDVGAGGGGAGDMTKAVYDAGDNGVVDAVDSISDHLENPPTEDEATKAPTSEWAFDHDADVDAHHAKYTDAEAVAAVEGTVKLDNLAAPDDTTDLDASDALHGLMPKDDKSKLDGVAVGADVTGDNDPKAHDSSHEWLGSDEIDPTPLVMNKMVFMDDFNTIDHLTSGDTGTGAVSWQSVLDYRLSTGTTSGSKAYAYTGACSYFSPMTVEHKWFVRASLRTSIANVTHYIWMAKDFTESSPSTTDKHVGWKVINGRLWATNADGSTETATDTGIDWALNSSKRLMVVGDATSIYYYVDDVLKATHTTNIPSAWSYQAYFYITNSAAADKDIWIHRWAYLAG